MSTLGTVTLPGVVTNNIGSDSTIVIGNSVFPISNTNPVARSVASFGETGSFKTRSERQEVTTSSAVVNIGVSIIGVNFNGPVVLTFQDSGVDFSDIYIVDEGGFCSNVNTITATSSSSVGSLVVSTPFSHMKARTNGTSWFSEVSSVIVNPDGSSTLTNEDGSETVTTVDGSQITTSSDGSTVSSVLPDGTTIEAVTSGNGAVESFTVLPDGTTIEEDLSRNGRESSVTISPDGTVLTETLKTNGATLEETINPDGSSETIKIASNGKRTETLVDANGITTVYVYTTWKNTYTSTIDGVRSTLSPNPYYVP